MPSFFGPRLAARRRLLALGVLAVVPSGALFACGARTALTAPEEAVVAAGDAQATDVRRDAPRDAALETLPPIDARPRDSSRNDCPDAEATLVYVVTEGTNELLAFNPAARTFRRIGVIACPAGRGTTPFSMAVDRSGVAYVLFNDGNLFRVSTLTAACVATGFVPQQLGIDTFGMGFSSDQGGPAETLFIASDDTIGRVSALGTIDTTTFGLNRIGAFDPAIQNAELTGTGDGRLFAFYGSGTPNQGPPSFIGEVDKATGTIIAEDTLASLGQGRGWAFAFWGGDFYTFTSPTGGTSIVNRFNPTTKALTQVATYPSLIVGAGVSTCAPSR